jgi:leucyl aminopeptidase (aminopeptidase T)
MRRLLSSIPQPFRSPELEAPAARIVAGALRLDAGERLVVLVDEERRELGLALATAARDVDASASLVVLETLGSRPLPGLPLAVRQELSQANASVFLIGIQEFPEVLLRRELFELVPKMGLRHAHMVGLGRRALLEGFAVEPATLAATVDTLASRLGDGTEVRARSSAGTDLVVRLSDRYRALRSGGFVRPGEPENLPSGMVVVHPQSVDGSFVCDASLLGRFAGRDGLLGHTPVRFDIEGGVCRQVASDDARLASAVEHHLRSAEHLERVGQVVLGANPGIRGPIGDALFDKAVPGLHLTFGFTHPSHTRATWTSRGILTATSAGTSVWVDGGLVAEAARLISST